LNNNIARVEKALASLDSRQCKFNSTDKSGASGTSDKLYIAANFGRGNLLDMFQSDAASNRKQTNLIIELNSYQESRNYIPNVYLNKSANVRFT